MNSLNETNEEWRPIHHHALYEVSNMGRVRTWKKGGVSKSLRDQPRMLKPAIDKKYGYPMVHLDGKTLRIHTLVAAAFVGSKPEGCIILHIDGNASNARADNLRYITPKDPILQERIKGKRGLGASYGTAKLDDGKVRLIRQRLAENATMTVIADEFGVSPAAVHSIKHGRTWKHLS